MQKKFLTHLSEMIDRYRQVTGPRSRRLGRFLLWLLPNGGTLLLIALLLLTQNVWAGDSLRNLSTINTASTQVIAYQGRLTDTSGNPLTGTHDMRFRLYSATSGGTHLWEEEWLNTNAVEVNDGLFHVMLGSLTPIPQSVITGNSTLFLGMTVNTDAEMTPRVQLGSVPFAVQALTVPDGSITTEKIADGSVTETKLNIGTLSIRGDTSNRSYLSLGKVSGLPSVYGDWIGLDFLHVNEVSPIPQFTGNPAARLSAVLERGDNGYGLGFWTRNRHDTFTEKVRVTADGHVGIGTLGHRFKLEVAGPAFTAIGNSGGGYYMTAGNGTLGHLFVTDRPCDDVGSGGISGAAEIANNGGARLCFKGGE